MAIVRQTQQTVFMITHDVDEPFCWPTASCS